MTTETAQLRCILHPSAQGYSNTPDEIHETHSRVQFIT